MRRLHRRGRETKKFLFLSSSRLCLMGWGSSSQVCSWADPGSSQLRTPAAKRCCRGFLEVEAWAGITFCILGREREKQKRLILCLGWEQEIQDTIGVIPDWNGKNTISLPLNGMGTGNLIVLLKHIIFFKDVAIFTNWLFLLLKYEIQSNINQ